MDQLKEGDNWEAKGKGNLVLTFFYVYIKIRKVAIICIYPPFTLIDLTIMVEALCGYAFVQQGLDDGTRDYDLSHFPARQPPKHETRTTERFRFNGLVKV